MTRTCILCTMYNMSGCVACDYKETSFVSLTSLCTVRCVVNCQLDIYGLKMMCVSKVNYYMHN